MAEPKKVFLTRQARARASFATMLRKFYRAIRRPMAWVLVVVAAASPLAPIPEIQIAALGALGLIILELLFELHKQVTQEKDVVVFSEFYEVSLALRGAIADRLHGNQRVCIRALGMSMGHAWPFLANTLVPILERDGRQVVDLQIAMLDAQWDRLEDLNPAWADRVGGNYRQILRFANEHRTLLERKGWRVSVHRYSHMPNWHGILIDQDLLFLGTCYWKSGLLTGGENQYELFRASESELATHRIEQFLSWFEFAQAGDSPARGPESEQKKKS